MDKKAATDIFGETIERGTVVMFCSSAAKLDMAVVLKVRWAAKNRLVGFTVQYPHHQAGVNDGAMTTKTKFVRAGRELACVPASKLSRLASAQAMYTMDFSSRLQYMAEKMKDA